MTDPILERILKKLQENGQTAKDLEHHLESVVKVSVE